MTEDPKQLVEVGRQLAQRGQVDAAVRTFLRAKAIDEAVAALVAVQRFADGGHLILNFLGVQPAHVGGLDAEKKKLAFKAAVCFAQAGETKTAVELYLALGQQMRAAETLERSGDEIAAARIRANLEGKAAAKVGNVPIRTAPSAMNHMVALRLERGGQLEEALAAYLQLRELPNAARVARQMGRLIEAGQLFEDAGMAYEAADCYLRGGDTGRGLSALVAVPRDHEHYRPACIVAIRLASDLNALDFSLDNFLSRFLADAPQNDREVEALYVLAKLYAARDFMENARELYQKILSVAKSYRDVPQRLAHIEAEMRGSTRTYEAIVREDLAYRGETGRRVAQPEEAFADLPDFPALGAPGKAAPASPEPSARAAAPASGTIAARPGAFSRPGTPPPTAAAAAPSFESMPLPPLPGNAGAVAADAVAGTIAGPMPTPHSQAHARYPADPPSAAQPTAPRAAAAPEPPSAPQVAPESAPRLVSPADLTPGVVIANRYKISRKLGQGGMAAVYAAVDLELGEEIAMKLFLEQSDEHLLARFRQEVSLSRRLAHPNIVRLFDIGTHEGYRFLTMELLEGKDLRGVMSNGLLPFPRALGLLVQTCQGLAVAHEAGVIHRDLKPENLFVTSKESVKVMDFGIAKGNKQQGLTVAGFMAGTPHYMSPEQINNFASVTHLSDIYALGCIAYELFTGTVPFDHEELMPLLTMHLATAPQPPSQRNPDIPAELEDIILRLLAKKPTERIQSCRDLAQLFSELRPTVGRPRR